MRTTEKRLNFEGGKLTKKMIAENMLIHKRSDGHFISGYSIMIRYNDVDHFFDGKNGCNLYYISFELTGEDIDDYDIIDSSYNTKDFITNVQKYFNEIILNN